MSTILPNEYEENIFDIVKKSSEPIIKIPRYVSKLKENLKESVHNNPMKKCHATMGLAEEAIPNPHNFLKKYTGQFKKINLPTREISQKQPQMKYKGYIKKEQINTYKKHLEEEQKNKKNFFISNIKNMINIKPKQLNVSKAFIKNEGFGKLPQYLSEYAYKRDKCEQANKDLVGTDKSSCKYIIRDEKEELLQGLKENWQELQKQYQGLPILTDTIPKIQRKLKLEKQLKQLEKDIVLLETHPYIYVYEDDDK